MVSANRLNRFKQVAASRQPGTVVLQDISDPHNAEAIFRSCDSFGIHNIHLIAEATQSFNPLALGKASSSSANKWLCCEQHKSTKGCLSELKAGGYTLFATVLDPAAESIFDADLDVPLPALMFGNEHSGLSDSAISQADRLITIPMQGIVQSLNISVSAALCLFELTRQRQALNSKNICVKEDERRDILSFLLQRHHQRK